MPLLLLLSLLAHGNQAADGGGSRVGELAAVIAAMGQAQHCDVQVNNCSCRILSGNIGFMSFKAGSASC